MNYPLQQVSPPALQICEAYQDPVDDQVDIQQPPIGPHSHDDSFPPFPLPRRTRVCYSSLLLFPPLRLLQVSSCYFPIPYLCFYNQIVCKVIVRW